LTAVPENISQSFSLFVYHTLAGWLVGWLVGWLYGWQYERYASGKTAFCWNNGSAMKRKV